MAFIGKTVVSTLIFAVAWAAVAGIFELNAWIQLTTFQGQAVAMPIMAAMYIVTVIWNND